MKIIQVVKRSAFHVVFLAIGAIFVYVNLGIISKLDMEYQTELKAAEAKYKAILDSTGIDFYYDPDMDEGKQITSRYGWNEGSSDIEELHRVDKLPAIVTSYSEKIEFDGREKLKASFGFKIKKPETLDMDMLYSFIKHINDIMEAPVVTKEKLRESIEGRMNASTYCFLKGDKTGRYKTQYTLFQNKGSIDLQIDIEPNSVN